ncbi:hypothetical protein BDQ17DRAFT_1329503 [Cyathus striatus]|nr:hypothetical protein BDQ17DRAFT_1329503 [Cyathus striatus]
MPFLESIVLLYRIIVGETIPGIAVTTVFSGTAKFVEPPYQPYPGCFLGTGSRIILSLVWIDLMVYDGFVMCDYTLSHHLCRHYNSSVTGIYAASWCHVLSISFRMERVTHSILTCRIILHIKGNTRSEDETISAENETLQFSPQDSSGDETWTV